MDVILDTNIYQTNFSLRSNQFDALSAYLRKTDDHLIVPYIVGQELLRNYKTSLKRAIRDIEKVASPFHNAVTTPELKTISDSIFSIGDYKWNRLEVDAQNYLNYISATLANVIIQQSLPPIGLDAIVERGLDKLKPFKSSGEGLKDAILWESVMHHGISNSLPRLIFISNNSNDFGKASLAENLATEVGTTAIEIVYYNDLGAFIENEFATVDNISLDAKDFDLDYLKLLVGFALQNEHDKLEALYELYTTSNKRYGDYQGVSSFAFDEVEKFVVKDIESDFKYIYATLICSCALVLVCETYTDYTNQITGDYEYDHDIELETVDVGIKIEVSLKKTQQGTEDLQFTSVDFL